MIKQIYRHWWVISGGGMVAITVLSLVPLSQLPDAPGSDKAHHFISYALVALPIALRRVSAWWMLILLCAVWGGVIECLQPLVNRYQEWADFLANSAGLLLGALMGLICRKFISKHLNNQ